MSARNKLGFNISPLFEKLLENEQNDFAHFLDAFTVILPVPDGAMPFNATAMACAAFVAHLVALSKVLTKRENYDEKAKTLRRLAKAVEKKKRRSKTPEKRKRRKVRRSSSGECLFVREECCCYALLSSAKKSPPPPRGWCVRFPFCWSRVEYSPSRACLVFLFSI